jgi:transcriptional regulator with XRE-family HTH domain
MRNDRRLPRQAASSNGKRKNTPAKPIGKQIGERIAALRLEKRLTLEGVAVGTGLTTSFLSKLERGQTSISVDNLRTVAHFLGVEMVHFFQDDAPLTVIVTRKNKGTPFLLGNTNASGESLINTARSMLQATLYRTPPGQGRASPFSHPGEEFVLVLGGRIRYKVGDTAFQLAEGDSIWHKSSDAHSWTNTGTAIALTLHVNTPPVW